MIGDGVFEEEKDGEKMCFQFGMMAGYFTEEKAGKGISAVLREIQKGQTMMHSLFWFYGGAKAYYEIRGIEKNITLPLVSTWMDKLGAEKCAEIYLKSVLSPVQKKVIAPTTTGRDE